LFGLKTNGATPEPGGRSFEMRRTRAASRLFRAIVFLFGTGLIQLGAAAPASAQTVVQHGWEDGTLQGWAPFGGSVVLTNSTAVAHSGTHSLLTSNRTAGFNGPSLNLIPLLSPSTVYQVSVYVRLAAGEPATQVKISVQRTPSGGSTAFDSVTGFTNVTDGGWVLLQGFYSFSGSVTTLTMYVESTSATASYYIDDFSVSVTTAVGCSNPPDTTGIHTNFETGTTQGWGPRIGRETVAVTTADAHTGTFSLLTTGRQAAFDGPSINAAGKLCNGSRYNVSVWVKLAPGQPASQIRVSLQRTFGGVTNFNTVIGNTAVTADAWVRLRSTYDFSFNYTSLSLYVESASGTTSFYIDDFDVTLVPPPVAERDIDSVHEAFTNEFQIGAAVWQGDLTGEHAFLLSKHFNSVTSENDMKWGPIEPTEGVFNFANADAQVAFAKAHNQVVRGHTLVWHGQNPAWLFRDLTGAPMTPTPENKALLLQRLENHIRALVTHFGDDVYAWDVVNEVIDPAQPDGFRRSEWYNITGTEYIERAFRVAREVAPNAKLYINDFSTTDEPKRTFLLNLVSDLQSRGVPIDGVGHQMHNNIEYPSAAAIIETLNKVSALGLDNQITELDISIYTSTLNQPFTAYEDIPADRFVREAFKYRDFFQAFRYLSSNISSVTLWGQADDHTWLTSSGRVNAPLLFDPALIHKLAYTALLHPSDLPGAESAMSFEGSYVVRAGQGGGRRTAAASFSLSNDGPSGTFRFNFNDPSTNVRFVASHFITYDVTSTPAGNRVDFTVVGPSAGTDGYIVTGFALDGGPAGSGLDIISITVRTALGAIVFSGEGPVNEGDVIVTR
jgi:endo-1,4-beta-xylanase